MRISIPEAARPLIEERMAKAGYDDAGEYILSLIERDRHRALREEVEELLLEAIDSPTTPMTSKDWDDIRRVGRKMIEKRKPR
jgi:hypothetical protein